MDEIMFPGGNRRRARASRGKKRDESGDLFGGSDSSSETADRISDNADTAKAICYRAIIHATRFGEYITRTEIATSHFDGRHAFVIDPVQDLMKDALVVEKVLRIRGVVQRDEETRDPIIEKRDGSALLVAVQFERSGEDE